MTDHYFKLYLKFWETGRRIGCHQRPERSFFIGNWQFPVCARCTGVLIGQPAMLILYLAGVRTSLPTELAFLALMFVDWFLQHIDLLSSTNSRRLITGLLAGAGLCGIYIRLIGYALQQLQL